MALMGLSLSACDGPPSAVIKEGNTQAASNSSAKPPFWATPAKPVTQADGPDLDVAGAFKPDPGLAPPPAAEDRVTASERPPKTLNDRHAAHFGKWPLWSSNRQYSASENAHYHFEKHGAEFRATSFDDYMARVQSFIHHPPSGTETLSRNNGDTLFYDPASNTFAVMTRQGAPRTMFHPDKGAAYWQKQKQTESTRRTWRRSGSGGDDGD